MPADLMAVLQITIPVGGLDLEAAVVTKKLVACRDIDVVAIECNAAQAAVGAANLEVYVTLVPVDVLLDFLFFKINRIYAAVTLALPTTAHDGCCDEHW